MKYKGLKSCVVAMVCFLILFLPSDLTQAADNETQVSTSDSQHDETDTMSGQTGFAVEVIPAATQIKKEMSFFYVQVKPEEEQTLQVKIISRRVEPSTVAITINDATTNIYGQLEYGNEITEFDESMKTPLTKIASLPEASITVENFEEKILEIKLNPPATPFDGVRLGAITFLSKDGKENEAAVTSAYGYKIGLMVSEDLTPYNVGGTLKLKKVQAQLSGGQKVVATTLQNPEPYVLENVTVQTKLTKKGSTEVMASNELANMKIAPNTAFDFLTYLGLEELAAGSYTIEVSGNDGNQSWHWLETFEVEKKEAAELNKKAAYKLVMVRRNKIIASVLFISAGCNVFYLVYRGGGKFGKKKNNGIFGISIRK